MSPSGLNILFGNPLEACQSNFNVQILNAICELPSTAHQH
jgi:hypothetical protein